MLYCTYALPKCLRRTSGNDYGKGEGKEGSEWVGWWAGLEFNNVWYWLDCGLWTGLPRATVAAADMIDGWLKGLSVDGPAGKVPAQVRGERPHFSTSAQRGGAAPHACKHGLGTGISTLYLSPSTEPRSANAKSATTTLTQRHQRHQPAARLCQFCCLLSLRLSLPTHTHTHTPLSVSLSLITYTSFQHRPSLYPLLFSPASAPSPFTSLASRPACACLFGCLSWLSSSRSRPGQSRLHATIMCKLSHAEHGSLTQPQPPVVLRVLFV